MNAHKLKVHTRVLILCILWLTGGVYAWHYLDRGWVPHDAGALGQSAERVLNGQLPHRDFQEIYSGGLSYINAIAFHLYEPSIIVMRWVLFIAFLMWLPIVYYVARRFLPWYCAAMGGLLVVVWSIPNYSAAMPSWYNLFLATFSAACLLRFIEVRHQRWLFLAGVATGISIVIKVIGFYVLAAELLALLYFEQVTTRSYDEQNGSPTYGVMLGVALSLFLALLIILLKNTLGASSFAHFVLPFLLLTLLLVHEEWSSAHARTVDRLRHVSRLTIPLALGVAMPLALFLMPYLSSGALPDLIAGVFVAPLSRLQSAVHPTPTVASLLLALPTVLYPIVISRYPDLRTLAYTTLGGLIIIALLFAGDWRIYRLVWLSMRNLVPVIVTLGCLVLVLKRTLLPDARRVQVFTILSLAAFFSLVQFPFSAPIYFMYVAPLALLSGLSLASMGTRHVHHVTFLVMIFYFFFTVRWINPGFIYALGARYAPHQQVERLDITRGGIFVHPGEARQYETLVELLRRLDAGEWIYAAPDCPEVYFLSGLRNPTGIMFEFLSAPVSDDELVRTLEKRDVKVIVLNREPDFSHPPSTQLLERLFDRYPRSTAVGTFMVRWKS